MSSSVPTSSGATILSCLVPSSLRSCAADIHLLKSNAPAASPDTFETVLGGGLGRTFRSKLGSKDAMVSSARKVVLPCY